MSNSKSGKLETIKEEEEEEEDDDDDDAIAIVIKSFIVTVIMFELTRQKQ